MNEPGEWGKGIDHLSASSGSVFDDTDSDPDALESPASHLPTPHDEAVADSSDDDYIPNMPNLDDDDMPKKAPT